MCQVSIAYLESQAQTPDTVCPLSSGEMQGLIVGAMK